MRIAILGTGPIGRAHAAKLSELGHEVFMGTHDVEKKLASTETDAMGTPPLSGWLENRDGIRLVTFAEAAGAGEIALNCLPGEASVATLSTFREALIGKLLIDISNPLDFSNGMPPSLCVCVIRIP